jgi:hypothetical protein
MAIEGLLLLLLQGQANSRSLGAFVPEDRSFSVAFPGPPIMDEIEIPTPTGPQTRHVFRYDDGDVVYFLWHACTPPPPLPSDPQKALDLAREEGRRTTGATPVSEKRIRVNGHPGREFVDELEGHRYFGQTVLGHHGAFYSFGGTARSPDAEARALAFVRSFRVLPASSRALCQPK